MNSLVLLRHAQTESNAQDVFQGRTDSPITHAGMTWINNIKSSFNGRLFDHVYVSPLPRCITTVQLLGYPTAVVEDRLVEVCYGDWEGRPKTDPHVAPHLLEREKNRFAFVHPGSYQGIVGESYSDQYDRLLPFWSGLEGDCLIVAHLGTMLCAMKYFNNLSNGEAAMFRPQKNSYLSICPAAEPVAKETIFYETL